MGENKKREWNVGGMDCAACTVKITKAVERLDGVSDVSIALMGERLSLTLAPDTTPIAQIEDTVRRLGFSVSPRNAPTPTTPPPAPQNPAPQNPVQPECASGCCAGEARDDHEGHSHGHSDAQGSETNHDTNRDTSHDTKHGGAGHSHDDPADQGKPFYRTRKGQFVILTGVLLSVSWIAELLTSAEIGAWAFTLACLIGVAPIAKRAFEAARIGQLFTIESLMTIAAIGALFIGAAEEAALVVFLFAVGEVLEGVAASKARDGIRSLANLVPKTALLVEGETTREIPAARLRLGQIVLVRPGDRIPSDGEITQGTSGIDESPITGESMPVSRGPGETVFAGAINTEAALRIRVTKEASDSTISRIIRLVEEAEEARAPTERFIDRFSRWYMPAITGLSALVVIVPPLVFGLDWDTWIYRGLALLLIGCPCALVISVPASIASALSSGARKGLLMKGGAVIEAAAKTALIAFDKTGTLTHGTPKVTDVVTAPDVSEGDLLAIAAAVEGGSSHPLAQAVLRYASETGIAPLSATDARAIPGKGVSAMVSGALAWVASPRHAAAENGIAADHIPRATALESEGKTVVAVFREGAPLGLIALRDEPRAEAADAMRQLGSMGIKPVILTGDNPRTAAAIAAQLGMEFRAEMMPEDKLAAIRDMGGQGGVMMIGDGINDAPALKQADIGVAMGSGTDVALETADAAILHDRVTDVPALIRLARAAMANIRMNVAIALGLKAVFLVTSILGLTGLWIAIMADTGATVLVTLNALRLLRFDPTKEG